LALAVTRKGVSVGEGTVAQAEIKSGGVGNLMPSPSVNSFYDCTRLSAVRNEFHRDDGSSHPADQRGKSQKARHPNRIMNAAEKARDDENGAHGTVVIATPFLFMS
jgi:hypothetical protein